MEAPISASQGAMRSLPGKLESLLSKPSMYGLQKGEKNKIRLLKGEIQELIDKYLMEPSEVASPALTANCWAKEVREMSYDIHDFVDELVDAGANMGVVQKTPRFDISRFREKLKRRQGITDQISGFRTRVKEAIQRHRSYLGNCKWRPSSSPVDERAPPPLYGEAGLRLVAMDKSSIGELYGWLANDGQPKRKVVSIVGIGGVGKTTLANEMYRKLAGQFQCRAFVRTSRRPDMKRILTSILSQVRRHQPPNNWEMHNLVVEINAYLKDKRYFIIIDDLWSSSTWDIINHALPKNNCCSRILTTTEVDVVAQTCCADNSNHMPSEKDDDSKYIFKKEPLSEDESRELFSNRVFGHQSKCPEHLEEVQHEIIKRTGGFPLAIITTASVLACQPASTEQWNYILNSLSSNLITNANPEGIKQILDLGYSNIPHRLKACMLYLSLYEEDYIIWKDDLVKQWIAEGFICATEGNDREELARSYFDELVNRGMIQPVDINCNDEVLSCTVHRMVLHLIRYKSIEENFITAIDHTQTAIRLADKVRRLSLLFSNAEHATRPASLRLSQVRSLYFFGLFKCIPSIVEFKLLQVLILQLWVEHGGMSYDLTEISELFRLRCLHINACHLHVILPMQMQRLKVLETLKIEAKVTAVPSDIVDLPRVSYLSLPSEAALPTGIGRMTSLRTLGYFDLGSYSEDNVKDLGKLIDLQDLHLTCSTVQPADNLENNMKCLGSTLGKLSSLKCLALVPAGSSNVDTVQDDAGASDMNISSDSFSMVSPPLALLQRLELSRRCCIFSSLPKWIEKHDNLCVLKIAVRRLSREDIDILEGLRALIALSLYIQTAPAERIVFRKGGLSFSVLKFFKFRCSAPRLLIAKDAMPKLQKLRLGFNAPTVDQHSTTLISIEHLSGLMEISAKVWGAGADAESILMTAVSNDPSNPKINAQLMNWNFYGDEGPCMATKETLHRAPEQQGEIQEDYPDKCYRTQHEGSGEDEKKQAERRISMQSESPSPLPVSGTRGTRVASALSKAQLQDGYVAYPWEKKMSDSLHMPNSSCYLSMLVLPKALDLNACRYESFEDTLARANTWLYSAQASGIPVEFMNVQSEALLTKISGETESATVNSGSLSDMSNLANATLYGFEDYDGVDIGVVKAARLWYGSMAGEMLLDIPLQEGDTKLGFAISRTEEGFIYISSVVDDYKDSEAPSTRSGLRDLFNRAKEASKLLIISRVSNEKVLPWMISSSGAVRCFDTVSLSQKLSLHRLALHPIQLHLLMWEKPVGLAQSIVRSPKLLPQSVLPQVPRSFVESIEPRVDVEEDYVSDLSFRFDNPSTRSSWV